MWNIEMASESRMRNMANELIGNNIKAKVILYHVSIRMVK